MLLNMGDDLHPIKPHTRGTVQVVDDMGTIHCSFDNGRTLGILPEKDGFRKLTEKELTEELDEAKMEDRSPSMEM